MHSILTTPKMAEKDVFNSFLVRNATYDGKKKSPELRPVTCCPKRLYPFQKPEAGKNTTRGYIFMNTIVFLNVFGGILKDICLL